jgi:hypothetical protein
VPHVTEKYVQIRRLADVNACAAGGKRLGNGQADSASTGGDEDSLGHGSVLRTVAGRWAFLDTDTVPPANSCSLAPVRQHRERRSLRKQRRTRVFSSGRSHSQRRGHQVSTGACDQLSSRYVHADHSANRRCAPGLDWFRSWHCGLRKTAANHGKANAIAEARQPTVAASVRKLPMTGCTDYRRRRHGKRGEDTGPRSGVVSTCLPRIRSPFQPPFPSRQDRNARGHRQQTARSGRRDLLQQQLQAFTPAPFIEV